AEKADDLAGADVERDRLDGAHLAPLPPEEALRGRAQPRLPLWHLEDLRQLGDVNDLFPHRRPEPSFSGLHPRPKPRYRGRDWASTTRGEDEKALAGALWPPASGCGRRGRSSRDRERCRRRLERPRRPRPAQ